jgi:hypothetical protein
VTLEGLLGGPGTILSKIIPPTESAYRENNHNILRKHHEGKNLPGISEIHKDHTESTASLLQ